MSKKLFITVCVGVFALSAFAASSASARWMVNGTTLGTGENAALATSAAVHERGLLKAAGVTIECDANTLEGTSPQIEGVGNGDQGSATSLIFKECSANKNCTVTKTIGTLPLMAVATLGTAPAVNVNFLPQTGTIFATIKFNGAECALLGTQPVTGKAKILAPTGQTEQQLQEIVANITEAANELKVGSSAAELKGAALLKLAAATNWSFL